MTLTLFLPNSKMFKLVSILHLTERYIHKWHGIKNALIDLADAGSANLEYFDYKESFSLQISRKDIILPIYFCFTLDIC